MAQELLIMSHAFAGVAAGIAALWAFIELLNASSKNTNRIKIASVTSTVLMWISYFLAADFYIYSYGPDKQIIKSGDWWWAHAFFTESKEHFFFLLILLSMLVVLVVYRTPFETDAAPRRFAQITLMTIFVIVAMAEFFGAVMTAGVRVGGGI